jgi:hypothetical protein
MIFMNLTFMLTFFGIEFTFIFVYESFYVIQLSADDLCGYCLLLKFSDEYQLHNIN